MTPIPDSNLPPLEPRLDGAPLEPPYKPLSYFFVGFFLGFVPMGYLAISNARRLNRDTALRNTTIGIAVAIAAVGFAVLAVAPASWVETNSDARLIIQIIGTVGSVALNWLHRGPALSRVMGSGDYASVWRKLVPLVVLALIQALIAFAIVSGRGLR